MEKLGELASVFLMGAACGLFGLILLSQEMPQKQFKSKQKATVDYELEAKGKVVDTIWIYKIK